MLFMLLLALISGIWENVETMLYGYSQQSICDAVAAIFAAAELAGRIERWMNESEENNDG